MAPLPTRRVACTILCVALTLLQAFQLPKAFAQTISFSSGNLAGESINNPTSLDFGPDNRLYVAQQDGTIHAYTITRNGPGNYQVTSTEVISIIRTIPNHNDNGAANPGDTRRQITGLLATGTNANPVLYVASSDPRIGGGGTAGDLNLDTNSGIISRLTWNGTSWTKTDVVVGLPRSEENHASNGMVLDEATQTLYLAQGGHTNAGAPSTNFAYLTEYALSAAILKIDIGRIETEFGGSYILPTLDDPTRTNVSPGVDVNDPFGGNDGRNQAKLVPGGPVQIHSPGYRNAYDLVLTRANGRSGRMYTIDNGANGNWGGHPDQEGAFGNPLQTSVTNRYVEGEPGSTGPGPNDAKVNNRDNLHYVSGPGFPPIYGGHPNPIRANPLGAGLHYYTTQHNFDLNPTADWPPVDPSMANPVEGDFRNPGVDDGALYTWPASTNGLAEYTSLNAFGGAMYGDLLAASFDGNVYRIVLTPDGTQVSSVTTLLSGFGTNPLDVIAVDDNGVFPGTIWVASYGSDNITVFEPIGPAQETWQNQPYASGTSPAQRHENGFVEVGGKFYLIGGRGTKPVNIFDPATNTWTAGAAPPLQLHHFQAVTYQNKIYVIAAMTGNFPNEVPVDRIYIYDPASNQWSQGDIIPAARRRGSAGVILYKNKFYIGGGIVNGHIDGWSNLFDEYNPQTGTWTPLPNLPEARDHFHAALINGKMYFAGGRRTGASGTFGATISNVNVYDIESGTWSTPTQIPTPRAAGATIAFNGRLLIAGGEVGSSSQALTVVEVYDPALNSWTTKPAMNVGRHGTQMIAYGNRLVVAAGSTTQGGSGETNTMSFAIYDISCTNAYDTEADDDLDGYSNADEIDNGTDPCSAGSKPSDQDNDFISDLNDTDDDNDGLADTTDPFALDPLNGSNTSLPIDYPFLNGEPGFGFFGVGHTGLMTNHADDYASLFDPDHPDLIVGGAVGVLSAPAEAGDARTNNQRYAFQFGVASPEDQKPFTIRTRLLGAPFFGGIALQNLKDQSQGIFIGTGDQDNYFRISLYANFGNPGIQLLREENGSVIVNETIPVTGILSSQEVDLLIDVDPESGEIAFRYQRNTDPFSIPIGTVYAASGNLLNALQSAPAFAVGVIASSGQAPPFSASWDLIRLTHPGPYVLNDYPDQQVFVGQTELIVPLELIFGNDEGIELLTFEVAETSNPALFNSIEIDETDLILGLNAVEGISTVTIRATDDNNQFVESSFNLTLVSDVTEIAHINAGGPSFEFENTVWLSDQYFSGGTQFTNAVPINNTLNDVLYQTERYGNFSYNIPVPESGTYAIDFHFAEIYHGVSNSRGVGARVFNVSVENNQFTLQNFDIIQTTGAATALIVRADDIEVTDGTLNISFTTVTDNAKVSGLSVYKNSTAPPDEPPFVIAAYPEQQIPITQTNIAIPLDEIFDDDKGFSGLNIAVTNISNPALVSATAIQGGQLTVTLNAVAGITNITLKATDASQGTAETTVTIRILPSTQHGTPVVRINSGGPAVQTGGQSWTADQYFTGGSTYSTTTAISNTTDDVIYQSERFGNVSYHIPVPQNGLYFVDIHLAEIYWTQVNRRIFNISVEGGQFTRQNLDLFQELGAAYTAMTIRAEPINIADGFLDITFSTVKDNAKVSGISVYHYSAENQSPTISPVSNITLVEGTFWSHQIVASDPDQGDVLSYSATGLPASLEIHPATGLISGTLEASPAMFNVTVRATDPEGAFDEETFVITVRENHAPSITTPPNMSANQGDTFSYQIQATDSDGDALSYSALNLPATLVVSPQTGLITGSVTAPAGTYAATVRATDPYGAMAQAGFTFEVIYTNQPPVASVAVSDRYCQGDPVTIAIQASDPEGGVLTFEIDPSGDPLPQGLSLNTSTGVISGSLPQSGNNQDYQVIVNVSDPEDAVTSVAVDIHSEDCTSGLRVTSLVLINSIADVEIGTLANGQSLYIGDLPSAINIKANVSEPAGSVRFAWQGNANYRTENVAPYALAGDNDGNYNNLAVGVGTYTVTATPYSGSGASGTPGIPLSLTFFVTNQQANTPPVVVKPPDVVVKENQSWTYQVQASDPGDVLTYSATGLPASLGINASTGLISGTLTSPPGEFTVSIQVEDAEGLTASTSFKINISENRPPVITIVAEAEVCRGASFSVAPVASDPDGDALTFALASTSDDLPAGLSLNTSTGVVSGTLSPTADVTTSHNIVIEVRDPGDATAQAPIEIIPKDCGSAMQVTSLVLVNSANETDILTLQDGMEIQSGSVPQQMNIRANVNPPTVGSVRFGFQGNPNYSTENVAPYALGGDNSGNYNNISFGVGTYAVTATPYPNANASGTPGSSLSLTFSIVPAGGSGLRNAAEVADEYSDSETGEPEFATLFPNPTQREVFIRIIATQAGACVVEMTSPLGRQVYTSAHELTVGTHILAFELEPSQYPAGIYLVSVVLGENKKLMKMVVR